MCLVNAQPPVLGQPFDVYTLFLSSTLHHMSICDVICWSSASVFCLLEAIITHLEFISLQAFLASLPGPNPAFCCLWYSLTCIIYKCDLVTFCSFNPSDGVQNVYEVKRYCSLPRTNNACVKNTLSIATPPLRLLSYVDIDVIHTINAPRSSSSIVVKNWIVGRPGNKGTCSLARHNLCREEESGHTATIELLPRQKLVTNEIHALRKLHP